MTRARVAADVSIALVTPSGPLLLLLLTGCAASSGAPPAAARSPQAAPPPRSAAPAASSGSASAPAPAPAGDTQGPSSSFRACGELACKRFASATDAFDYVLGEAPRVLAVGEAHAQSDAAIGASTTRRFMDQLLPRLAPRASDLVIELWLANGTCGKVERKVQEQQAAVTAPQAQSNQGEFVELGHRAKALGIVPHALVPSCDQYRKISEAGPSDIEEMLAMIAAVTQHDIEALLQARTPERTVVAYGGAMHNDLVPRAGRESFSFGPALSQATSGRFVELDLVVPEQIKDSDVWRALPWHAAYLQQNQDDGAYLFSWAPHAYALIFPRAESGAK